MPSIVRWLWNFGDGEESALPSPFHIYRRPGFYDVTLKVWDEFGNTRQVTKTDYINVFGFAETLFSYGVNRDRQCLVYGNSDTTGTGWVEFSGDNWLFPETRAAMPVLNVGDDRIKICFDFDTGLPFVMNQKKSFGVDHDLYRDMVGHPDEPDGYPIRALIITPEMRGSSRKFKIKHEETYSDIRLIDGDYQPTDRISVDAHLINEGRPVQTERIADINQDSEVLFSHKAMYDFFQIGLEFSHSGFRVEGIETTCKVSDTARYANDVIVEDRSFQLYMSTATKWFTRPGYDSNRSTGDTLLITGSSTNGADLYENSAFLLSTPLDIDTADDTLMVLWRKHDVDSNILLDGVLTALPDPFVGNITTTNWDLHLVDITSVSVVTLPVGFIVFDLRCFMSTVTNEKHFENYIHDVFLNRGEKFLPGYIE